jgi:hypothetical protein
MSLPLQNEGVDIGSTV